MGALWDVERRNHSSEPEEDDLFKGAIMGSGSDADLLDEGRR